MVNNISINTLDKNLLPGTWRLQKMIYHDGSVISYTGKDGWEQYVFKPDGTIDKENMTALEVQKSPHVEEWFAEGDQIFITLAGKPTYTVYSLTTDELILKNTDRDVRWGYKRMQ